MSWEYKTSACACVSMKSGLARGRDSSCKQKGLSFWGREWDNMIKTGRANIRIGLQGKQFCVKVLCVKDV